MNIYYDLHIHTGLSPCCNEDMTPNNIVNMALLNELDVIAITDHNTCGNVAAVMAVAEGTGLIVLAGMEVETSEEVHTVCLFESLERCQTFGEVVASKLPPIANKPDIFGRQLYFNADDEIVGECEQLLIVATTIDLFELQQLVKAHGGVLIPAHIDRASNSIMANLGFIPQDLDINTVEFSKNTDPVAFLHDNKRLFFKNYRTIQSSDAHYLGDIAEKINFLEFDTKPTAAEIVKKLAAGE